MQGLSFGGRLMIAVGGKTRTPSGGYFPEDYRQINLPKGKYEVAWTLQGTEFYRSELSLTDAKDQQFAVFYTKRQVTDARGNKRKIVSLGQNSTTNSFRVSP